MGKAKRKASERLVSLTTAITAIKQKWPEATEGALRKAVAKGKVPFQRTSDAKKARYFVRLKDLEQWYISQGTITA